VKIKNIFINIVFILVTSSLNLAIFFVAYNKLTFPFLHEDQRMDNAPLIFYYVVPSFIVVAICVLLITYILNKIKA
jgi:hypothetical protein